MRQFSSAFDEFSSLKQEYKNSLQESRNSMYMSNQKLAIRNQFAEILHTPFENRMKHEFEDENSCFGLRTPYHKVHSSPFPDLNTVFKERRHHACQEVQRFSTNNLYQTLNLDASASQPEITNAYRKLSLKYHPDKKGGDPERFIQLNQAYKILSNEELRQIYDDQGLPYVLTYMATVM